MYCIYNVLTSRKSNSICLFLRLIYKHTCTHIWIYIFTLISERKKKKKVIFNTTLLPVLVWKACLPFPSRSGVNPGSLLLIKIRTGLCSNQAYGDLYEGKYNGIFYSRYEYMDSEYMVIQEV